MGKRMANEKARPEGDKPTRTINAGGFTYNSDSAIAPNAGQTAMAKRMAQQAAGKARPGFNKPTTTNSGKFTFDSDSSIGGGQTAFTKRQNPVINPFTPGGGASTTDSQLAGAARPATTRSGIGGFTYNSDSNIGGGQTAFTAKQNPPSLGGKWATIHDLHISYTHALRLHPAMRRACTPLAFSYPAPTPKF